MSKREYAVRVVEALPEEKLEAFLTLFADDNMLARIETEMVARDPNAPQYSDFREFMNYMDS